MEEEETVLPLLAVEVVVVVLVVQDLLELLHLAGEVILVMVAFWELVDKVELVEALLADQVLQNMVVLEAEGMTTPAKVLHMLQVLYMEVEEEVMEEDLAQQILRLMEQKEVNLAHTSREEEELADLTTLPIQQLVEQEVMVHQYVADMVVEAVEQQHHLVQELLEGQEVFLVVVAEEEVRVRAELEVMEVLVEVAPYGYILGKN